MRRSDIRTTKGLEKHLSKLSTYPKPFVFVRRILGEDRETKFEH